MCSTNAYNPYKFKSNQHSLLLHQNKLISHNRPAILFCYFPLYYRSPFFSCPLTAGDESNWTSQTKSIISQHFSKASASLYNLHLSTTPKTTCPASIGWNCIFMKSSSRQHLAQRGTLIIKNAIKLYSFDIVEPVVNQCEQCEMIYNRNLPWMENRIFFYYNNVDTQPWWKYDFITVCYRCKLSLHA